MSLRPALAAETPFQKNKNTAGEMSLQLRASIALQENLNSVPSTYSGWLTTDCMFNCKGSSILFWSPQLPTHIRHVCIHTYTYK